MEIAIFEWIKSLLGWEIIDGIMAPGGSISNFYALIAAKHYKFPSFKEKGMYGGPKLKILTSEASHYSLDKAAIILGIGSENVVKIKCNSEAIMDMNDLRK